MKAARQALISGVGTAIQRYQRSTDALDDVTAARLDLNRTDLRCLDRLSEGPTGIGQLALATGLSSAATTTLVDRLEAKGYARRLRDASDRRRIRVELTASASERVADLYGPLVSEGSRLLENHTNAELAVLRDFFVNSTELTERHRRRITDAGQERVDRAATGGRDGT